MKICLQPQCMQMRIFSILQKFLYMSISHLRFKKCTLNAMYEYTEKLLLQILPHWDRVTHICISKIAIISSDNGLLPGHWQAIIWTNAGILLIRPLGTNLSEIVIEIHIFLFKKMHLKISSGNWQRFCLRLNVLMTLCSIPHRYVLDPKYTACIYISVWYIVANNHVQLLHAGGFCQLTRNPGLKPDDNTPSRVSCSKPAV